MILKKYDIHSWSEPVECDIKGHFIKGNYVGALSTRCTIKITEKKKNTSLFCAH